MAKKCTERFAVVSFYLRRGSEAALWRRADRRVRVFHAIFHTGSSQHFYVGDREDALTVGAWDFAFIPVFIHSTNERDPLSLQSEDGFPIPCEYADPFRSRTRTSHGCEYSGSNLSKRHFHHSIPTEVKAGNGLSILQHLHWDAFLRLGLLRYGKELKATGKDKSK